jgi:protein-tyrosine phosphatase
VIDLHCHILPGIDDGPQTMEDSLAIAKAAVAAGTRTIVATPHVSWEYRNDAATIARLVGLVNASLLAAGVPLKVRAGAEIEMTMAAELNDRDLSRLTLGGRRWLLLEPPFTSVVSGVDLLVATFERKGYGVVIAHPERCAAFQRDPQILEASIAAGALCSLTAGSLVGRFGAAVQRFAEQLVRYGLVHNVASDAHDAVQRPPGMAAELADADLESLADWLTRAVPAAILDGSNIPPRPMVELREQPTGGGGSLLRRARHG